MKLWASSTAPDTDFTAKLVDVYPPSKDFPAGFDIGVQDGIIRARYRNSLEHAELMKPGEVYQISIEMYPTAMIFKKGHRIRVDISSSNFPRFDVNPNTGEPLNGPAATLGQRLYVARGRARLSTKEAANGVGLRKDLIEAVEAEEPATEDETSRIKDLIAALGG